MASNPNGELVFNRQTTSADLNVGALWYSAPVKLNLGKERNISAYLGGSAFHLNTPSNQSYTGKMAKLPVRYSIQGGFKIIGEKFDLSPNFYSYVQERNKLISYGLLVDYKRDAINKISAGVWYGSDAVAFCLGYTWLQMRLMYSYDVAHTSPVSNSVSALQAHEITLTINFNKASQKNIKTVPSFL